MKAKKFLFSIEVIPEVDGQGYYVVVPSLPGCFSQGETVEDAIQNAQAAIALHVRSLKKNGQMIPVSDKSVHTVVEIAA